MNLNYFRTNYKVVLAIIALVFFVISIIVHQQSDYFSYRLIRAIICFTFLGLLFIVKGNKSNSLLQLFLLFYGGSSLATIWYENNNIAVLAMVLNLVSYLFLIRAVAPKINMKKMNVTFTLIFSVLVLFNAYLLYEFILMIKDLTLSNAHYIFMLLGAMSLVILAFLALLYNYIYSTKHSLLFTFFVFIMIFGEIFRAIGYYDFAYGSISVYIARALFLLSLCLLIHYTMMDKNKDERLNHRLL